MRRSWTALAALSALALVGTACAQAKDTGFPPPVVSSSTSASPSASVPTTPITAVTLVGKNIQWDLKELLFKANEKITVTVDNQDTSLNVPHNFGLYTNATRTLDKEIYKPPPPDAQPGQKKDYVLPALKAGTYYFQCDIHSSMNGTVTVK
jgi:plastocyanin